MKENMRNVITSIGIAISVLLFLSIVSYVIASMARMRARAKLPMRTPVYCPEDTHYQVVIDMDTVYLWDCDRLVGKYIVTNESMKYGMDSLIGVDNQ